MTWPAEGMSTPTPSAMSGSTPIVTNSVVPIANPPMASATTATTTRTVLRGGRSVEGGAALTPAAKGERSAGIPGSGRPGAPPQPQEVGGRRRAPRRAGRKPVEAGLPDGGVVRGLGQLGVPEQQFGTAAAQDGLPEQCRHPLPRDGDTGGAGGGQDRARIALERRADRSPGQQPAHLIQVALDPAEQPVGAGSDQFGTQQPPETGELRAEGHLRRLPAVELRGGLDRGSPLP